MISIGVERLADCWDDIIRLGSLHWKETMEWQHGRQEFSPSRDRYQCYEDLGILVLFVVRDDGRYAGHGMMYLTPSMHTQALIAVEDFMFLLPEYRNNGTGRLLYETVEAEMWRRGAVEICVTAKPGSRSARMLEAMGCTLTDLRYSKHIRRADSASPPIAVTETSSDVRSRCSDPD